MPNGLQSDRGAPRADLALSSECSAIVIASRQLIRAVEFLQYRTRSCWMLHRARISALTMVSAASLVSGIASAQQNVSATAAAPNGPAVNDVAPDFSLPGADRYGLLKTPVRLSDYRGPTVVLAFFFQAPPKG